MRLRCMGCEDLVLEGISPALLAMASDFSLRSQRKVTKRKVTLADSLSLVEYTHLCHSTDGTRRRAFHGPPSLARILISRSSAVASSRRIKGGANTVSVYNWGGRAPLS